MNFCHNLRNLIVTNKYSYRSLSENLNEKYELTFTKSTLQNWVKGHSAPSINHAVVLADYFEVTLDELVGVERFKKDVEISTTATLRELEEDALDSILRELQ